MFNNLFLANPPASGSGGVYWFHRMQNSSAALPSIAIDSSLNRYIVGTGSSSSAAIAKLSDSSTILWQRAFTANNSSTFNDVKLDSSGNIYAVGSLAGNAFIVKYNNSGTILWQRTLGSASATTVASRVAVDTSGNVYLAGYSMVSFKALLIAKYNTSGTLQWQRIATSAGGGDETLEGIAVDSSGSVYASGYRISANYYNSYIVKYNTSGTLQWERSLSATSEDSMAGGIAVDSSSNVYVCGIRVPAGGATRSTFLAKYNSTGTLSWKQQVANQPIQFNFLPSVQVDSAGNAYILCSIDDASSGYDFGILKYNTSGTLQWQRQLFSYGQETGSIIALSSDGSAMFLNGVCGYIFGSTSQVNAWFTAKLPTDGSLTANYGSPNPFIYESRSYSNSSSTLTESQPSAGFQSGSLTSATSTETDTAGSFTSQVTNI